MRILMVLAQGFPPDIRVEKEGRTLAQAGHEVYLLCQRRGNEPANAIVQSMNVIRVKAPQNLLRWTPDYAFQRMGFQSPFWKRVIYNLVAQYRIEAIHVHDLPLVSTSLLAARRFNIPLVADLHDVQSMAAKSYDLSFWARLANNLAPWERHERRCMKYADRIITVSNDCKNYYVERYHPSSNKLTVIMNTVDLDRVSSFRVNKEIIDRFKQYFIMSYVGAVSRRRGIQTAVSAMPKIVSKIPNARLLLVGGVIKETLLGWARDDIDRATIENHVIFTGRQDYSLVPSYISASNVCLIPVIPTPYSDVAAPNKLFEYWALRKPVVASSLKSLRRFIAETGGGLVFTAGEPASLADAIIKLHDDRELANKLGEAGFTAVKARYNWEIDGKKLVDLYRDLKGQVDEGIFRRR